MGRASATVFAVLAGLHSGCRGLLRILHRDIVSRQSQAARPPLTQQRRFRTRPTSEEEAIRKVIEEAYIEGIHGTQDEQTVKSGFHTDFAMLVLHDDEIDKVNVD